MGMVFTPQEAEARRQRFGRGEVRVVTFTFNSLNAALGLTPAAFASFTADKDYVIRRVFMSATGYNITAPLLGLAVLAYSDLGGISSFPAAAVQVGGVIASMAYRTENSQAFVFEGDDEKENVPLEKNRAVYAHLRNNSADGSSMVQITMHLLPVGTQ